MGGAAKEGKKNREEIRRNKIEKKTQKTYNDLLIFPYTPVDYVTTFGVPLKVSDLLLD